MSEPKSTLPAAQPGTAGTERRNLAVASRELTRQGLSARTVGALQNRVRSLSSIREDKEFLPAHLEILDTPASPYAVAFTWAICAMFATAILWSVFAKIDIHAVAAGRVQPSGRSKVVQPFETAKVQGIFTQNGATVKAGDPLIKLDATDAEADLTSRRNDFSSYEAQVLRRVSTIQAVEKGGKLQVKFPDTIPGPIQDRERATAESEVSQFVATREALISQLAEREATKARFTASIAARERLRTVLKERADMRETLVARAAGTRAAVIDAIQQVEQVQADLAYDRGQLAEAEAGAVSLKRRIDQLVSETVAKQYQEIATAAQKRDSVRQDMVKAELRRDRLTLTAPIDGIVQQLSVTTLGQVVSATQPLLVVVPTEGPIEIEALIANQDIGFVVPDQEAVVKVDAFPFTRYGSLKGKVLRVSRDAVDDRDASGQTDALSLARGQSLSQQITNTPKTQNLVFPVTIQLEQNSIDADGKTVPLTPGMTVAVEIRTGDRRVIDYVLSPIKETVSSAGRER